MRGFFATAAVLGLAGAYLTAPATADSVTLEQAAGLRIDGPAESAQLGYAIAGAGDYDGDGYDDLIIGSPSLSAHGDWSGGAYIVFGGRDLTSGAVGTSRTIRIDGATAFDQAGSSVAGAGDVNKDGFDDVLIGAPAADPQGREYAGTAYLVLGRKTPVNLDFSHSENGWHKFMGAAAWHWAGEGVAGAGDVNADGFPDMLVSAIGQEQGTVHVIFGRQFPGSLDLAASSASDGIALRGGADNMQAGWSVGGLGDVNGDGVADIGVGAPTSDNYTGYAYVVYGRSGLDTLNLTGLTATAGFRLTGTSASQVGTAMAGVGDMNKDGLQDFAVGAFGVNEVAVVYGRATSGNLGLGSLGDRGFLLIGPPKTGTGGTLAGIGDVNQDGFADVVTSVPYPADTIGYAAVVHGAGGLSDMQLATEALLLRGTAGDGTGRAVAGLGDVNGDGGSDYAVSAPNAKVNGSHSGSVYVVYGSPPVVPPDEPVPEPPVVVAPIVVPQPATPAATLTVVARPARKAVRRTGKTVLVRDVTVGAGQTAAIVVKAPKRVRVVKTATMVTVRARKAPKRKVVVQITASGEGFTPTTWSRTWRVR